MAIRKPKAGSTPKSKAKAKPKAKKAPMFVSVKVAMYHPFARVSIPTDPPGVQLDADDSWLKSQLAGGLVKEL